MGRVEQRHVLVAQRVPLAQRAVLLVGQRAQLLAARLARRAHRRTRAQARLQLRLAHRALHRTQAHARRQEQRLRERDTTHLLKLCSCKRRPLCCSAA